MLNAISDVKTVHTVFCCIQKLELGIVCHLRYEYNTLCSVVCNSYS